MNNRDKVKNWLDTQIEFRKYLVGEINIGKGRVQAIDIRDNKEIHVVGVKTIAKALNYPLIKRIWKEGNEQCNTDYLEVYIYYKGYKVFELVDRIGGKY